VRDLAKGTSTPRGGVTPSSVTVAVGEPPAAFAPVFTTCLSTVAAPVRPGDAVSFYVAAEELAGSPPAIVTVSSFTWADATGRPGAFVALAPPATDAVAWTAPPCGGRAAPFDVVVTATAVGTNVDVATGQRLTTAFPFPVRVTCP
jgi:hypothetical protein